jgi:chromosome segregation ATPase
MELRMLREEHNRVQTKAENVVASAVSNTAQLEQDRDEALAKVNDLQLRLSSVMADLEIVKADSERLVLSNNNLQVALEAFQSEREAEMAMIDERKTEERDAANAAHAAELDALKLVLQNELRQVQKAADDAVRNTMEEVKELEGKLENLRVENVQTRRALDEAIDRLSQTQDDVVDRTVMKNILLDWLTKAGKKERSQVLEMMADLLHFTDDEKRRVHVDGRSPSIRNIMSPPPSKVDVKNLEGENVREKWVNFLLAESDDS